MKCSPDSLQLRDSVQTLRSMLFRLATAGICLAYCWPLCQNPLSQIELKRCRIRRATRQNPKFQNLASPANLRTELSASRQLAQSRSPPDCSWRCLQEVGSLLQVHQCGVNHGCCPRSPMAMSFLRDAGDRSGQASIRARMSAQNAPLWISTAPDSAPHSLKEAVFSVFSGAVRIPPPLP